MEFWNKFYKKVTKAANYTAKETEKYTEITKVKFNLMREKIRLEEAYKELGEIYYSQIKTSETDEKAVSLAYDKIEACILEVEKLGTQLNILKDTKVCDQCGVKLEKGMEFCPKCGAKQAEEVEEETEELNETEQVDVE